MEFVSEKGASAQKSRASRVNRLEAREPYTLHLTFWIFRFSFFLLSPLYSRLHKEETCCNKCKSVSQKKYVLLSQFLFNIINL
jgi:hypothetical protein